MIEAKAVLMFTKLSVYSYVMTVCLYAMIRAVDGIIHSRSCAFYTTTYFYASILKML